MKNTKENKRSPRARSDELVVQDLPDEVLIYDLKSHKAHCLNETAAFVWNHCDGQRTADDIARLMELEWRTPVAVDTVWSTLGKLGKAELLQEPIALPPSVGGVSRRNALRQLGRGALMAAPVVLSIAAPKAASAASIPPICTACRKKSDGACPAACGPTILGTCYDNAGCGNGQARACVSCGDCFAGLGGTNPPHTTISWSAPGASC